MLNANWLNQIQLSHINSVWLKNLVLQLCQNLKTSTTESTEPLNPFTKISPAWLKTDKSHQPKTSKKDQKDLLNNLDGKRTTQLKSGASALTTLDLTWLSMSQKESNTWTKLKNQWFLHSSGLQDKVSSAMKTWEVWDSMSLIANCTLMPFTEVEAKSCQLQEDSIMLWKFLVNQVFLSLSSFVRSLLPCNLWVVSIKLWTQEEVKSLKKIRLLVPHSVKLKLIFQSLNPSVSLEHWEETLKVKLSHKMCLTTGAWLKDCPMKTLKQVSLLLVSEREKDLKKNYQNSTTIKIKCDLHIVCI